MKLIKFLALGILALSSIGCQTYVVNIPPPKPTYSAPKKASASITPTVEQTPDVVRSWE